MSELPEATALPVEFQDDDPGEVPIDMVALQKKKVDSKAKIAERAVEAQLYQEVGAKVIRIKAKTLAMLGAYADKFGVKKVGHGRLLVCGDNSEVTMEEIDQSIKTLTAANAVANADRIIALLQLKRDMNRQLIDIAEHHIKGDRQIAPAPNGASLQVPFPTGDKMTLVISNNGPKTPTPLDAPTPEG